MRRMHLVVRGLVQGVGFRDFVQRRARRRGLTGYVQNTSDGSVVVVAEGPEAELQALAEAVRQGPRLARVHGVEAAWDEPAGDLEGFRIRW